MTLIQRSDAGDGANRPANDNDNAAPAFLSALDGIYLADDDEAIADLVRRTERKAIALVVGMAICLIFVPALWLALSYGI
ncbi:hypothetical protein [Mesorhizobium sp. M7A.F.Ce.TU.012.03.2.1]|uniref:hypothetical protein n=1 Tax=Mesorhizobium sp. M7A.F.Ce.TU.012.03.2.1 TaxID=2493681 RepID=UPI000FDAB03C|nr:hypothetical protein [Mesorhizobium sp. M7A.F.Ce.TU.012.03.2.1]AZV18137.1 hypothetical protein EJ079_03025 [Mesorhizobium sp. M7A.F.Ce.TU.012.03.2.1]